MGAQAGPKGTEQAKRSIAKRNTHVSNKETVRNIQETSQGEEHQITGGLYIESLVYLYMCVYYIYIYITCEFILYIRFFGTKAFDVKGHESVARFSPLSVSFCPCGAGWRCVFACPFASAGLRYCFVPSSSDLPKAAEDGFSGNEAMLHVSISSRSNQTQSNQCGLRSQLNP